MGSNLKLTRGQRALSTVSGLAIILAAQAAQAAPVAPQSQASSDTAVEELVITGSRVVRDGFQAPTPVTVMGTEQLAQQTPASMADAVASLPSMRFTGAATTANGTGNGSGLTFLNLRGLGSQRTLTLLDGRRFVPSTGTGGTDINLFPSALVERVEVVTGGASAAYGSDAVGGVANFILDKRFTGLKFDTQVGVSDYGDAQEAQTSLAFGHAFGGDRGHFLFSTELSTRMGVKWKGDRDWQRTAYQLIPNPAFVAGSGLPSRLVRPNVKLSRESYGGLVTSGPFRGATFDPNGQPTQFDFGTLTSSSFQVGGSGADNALSGALTAPLNRGTAFTRFSWELNDAVTLYAEGLYGATRNRFDNGWSYASGNTAITIQRDNAFLPDSLRQRMVTANVSTLSIGRALRDAPSTFTYGRNWTQRYVGGADFNFGGSWTGGLYYEWGRNRNKQVVPGNLNQARFYPAVDAVVNPANGRIVCRSTLTNPTDGCIPYNIFGEGNASREAIAWAFGESVALARSTEQAAAFTVEGEPINLWAGPVSLAGGVEYRKEAYDQTSDPFSQALNPITGTIGQWRNSNPQPQVGEFSVKEAFVETVVPLAHGMKFADSADLNAAYRIADYSLSGSVSSWKIGLTYSPIPDLRFRGTRSRDVRAPNLSELFLGGNQGVATVRDPFQNNRVVGGLRTTTGGNPALTPELADTWTYGVVYSPTWFRGFTASIDFYDIDIDDAIGNLGGQTALDQCYAGADLACSLISRDASGNLIAIKTSPLNLSGIKNSGYDIEASYRAQLDDIVAGLPGAITLRALGTHTTHQITITPGAAPIDRAGDIGASSPKWRWTGQVTYNLGPWDLFLQARYLGGGVLDVTAPPGDIDSFFNIPSIVYADARVSYEVRDGWTAYLAINNLFNKDPHVVAGSANQADVTNKALYDAIGRMFRVGLQARF